MKNKIILSLVLSLAIGLGACSTVQRLDQGGFFDDVLVKLVDDGLVFLLTKVIQSEASESSVATAIGFLEIQRDQGNYSPVGLLFEAKKTPYNLVLNNTLAVYEEYIKENEIYPTEKHINSLIQGINLAVSR